MMDDHERDTLVASIVNLIPALPDGADGYFLNIGGGRGKYIRDPQGVAEEIVDIACCQEICKITGLGKWDASSGRWYDAPEDGFTEWGWAFRDWGIGRSRAP